MEALEITMRTKFAFVSGENQLRSNGDTGVEAVPICSARCHRDNSENSDVVRRTTRDRNTTRCQSSPGARSHTTQYATFEDFERVIKEPLKQQLRGHIDYIKKLDLFQHFPCEKLRDFQSQFFYQYFKKDTLVVPSSRDSDYLVIVKSGSCRVVSEVRAPHGTSTRQLTRRRELARAFPLETHRRKLTKSKARFKTNEILQWETGELRDVIKSNMEAGWTQPQRLDSSDSKADPESWMLRRKKLVKLCEEIDERRVRMRKISSITDPAFSDTCVDAPSASMIAEDRFTPTPSSADSGRGRRSAKSGTGRTLKRVSHKVKRLEEKQRREENEEKECDVSYAQIATLGPGQVFGLENLFQKYPTRLSLVSDGAECILMAKKLFIRECNAKVLKVVSEIVVSYPSETFVQQQLRERRNWVRFKRHLVNEVIARPAAPSTVRH